MVGIQSVASIVLGCLPPTVPLYRDRCHCPSNVDHLCRRLVDIVVRICNLSDADNNVLYQSDFFVDLENIEPA